MITVAPVDETGWDEYERLNLAARPSMIYAGTRFRDFLQRVVGKSRPMYLGAKSDGRLVAAMPSFVIEGDYGPIINSLPFFGSHGGVIKDPSLVGDAADRVAQQLLAALDSLATEVGAVTTTIISNPLGVEEMSFYDANARATLFDDRIGQITSLPVAPADPSTALMDIFHQKTRNSIRKAQKLGYQIVRSRAECLEDLHKLHVENMTAIGGRSKPWPIFEAIAGTFAPEGFAVYSAHIGQEMAAGLLVLFYNDTVEYFTPVIHPEHRSGQALSLLIFEAMKDAVAAGRSYWNWGGTWLTQDGVKSFKERWGTSNLPYRYYVREYPQHGTFRDRTAAELSAAYPLAYTIPFAYARLSSA